MNRKITAGIIGFGLGFLVSFGLSFLMARVGAEPGYSPMILGATIGTLTYAILANLSGNRKMRTADRGARDAALTMAPADAALLVIYREGFIAKAVGVDVTLDGKDLAQLKSPRFTALEVAPGTHRLAASLAGQMNASSKPGVAEFDLAAGETAVFRITLKMKLATSDVILAREADPAAPKKKLARMTMIAPTA